MKKIVLFASGSGTNAQNIILFFKNNGNAEVVSVFTNNKDAGVVQRAKKLQTQCVIFDKAQFYKSGETAALLMQLNPDLIVLAGFLWLIPETIIHAFKGKIINIHPALLPKYGGKGMYGQHVHEAVIQNKEKESGITIHYVNEKYDEGNIIFQARCNVDPAETPDSLAHKIHMLEYEHYPAVVASLI